MKLRIVAAVAGLSIAAASAPPRVNAALPATACSTGALQVCAAVSASTSFVAGKWHLALKVWNLFGLSGVSHVITYVGVGSSSFTGTAQLASATYNGNAVSWKAVKNINNNPVGAELDFATQTKNGINQGLVGCGVPTPPGYSTCYPGGLYLLLDFTTSTQFDLTDPTAVYGWHSQAIDNGSCSLWVDSQGNHTQDSAAGTCSSVVPEPVTMLLLGTGLASMGGFGFVRRRKRNDDGEST